MSIHDGVRRWRRRCAVVAVVACLAGAGRAAEDGRAALEAAAREKQDAYALQDEGRELALLAAAESFAAVVEVPEHAADVRAEAAFRAGEILRSRERADEAGALFVAGLQAGDVTLPADDPEGTVDPRELEGLRQAREFAARCQLELAHLARRGDDLEAALVSYRRVRERFADRDRQAAHGRTWEVKMLVALERWDAAVEGALAFVRRHPGYPLESVRNMGRVVHGLMAAQRGAQADRLFEEVEALLARTLEEEDAGGPIASALEAVRVTLRAGSR